MFLIPLKFERTKWLYHRVMRPKDADGMANSVEPDQTARASGSTLSENLGLFEFSF